MDITDAILHDHDEQRALFAVIEQIDPSDTEALAAVWRRLRILLEVHAAAEEEHFYPRLLAIGRGANDADSPEAETEDAIDDHNKIRDAAEAAERHPVGSPEWFAAVDKANLENSKHMAEEERQALADFRRYAPLEQRHRLALRFLTFKYQHLTGVEAKDKDAKDYIAAHGGDVNALDD